jgi:hypothetical protein
VLAQLEPSYAVAQFRTKEDGGYGNAGQHSGQLGGLLLVKTTASGTPVVYIAQSKSLGTRESACAGLAFAGAASHATAVRAVLAMRGTALRLESRGVVDLASTYPALADRQWVRTLASSHDASGSIFAFRSSGLATPHVRSAPKAKLQAPAKRDAKRALPACTRSAPDPDAEGRRTRSSATADVAARQAAAPREAAARGGGGSVSTRRCQCGNTSDLVKVWKCQCCDELICPSCAEAGHCYDCASPF